LGITQRTDLLARSGENYSAQSAAPHFSSCAEWQHGRYWNSWLQARRKALEIPLEWILPTGEFSAVFLIVWELAAVLAELELALPGALL
jgi:hypothetical protein